MASSDELNLGLEELGQLAKSAAGDFSQLSAAVKSFASSPMIKDKLNANLKNARQLLRDAGGNADYLKAALRGAGVTGRETSAIVKQLAAETERSKKEAKGLESAWSRIFSGANLAKAAHAVQLVSAGFSAAKTLAGGAFGLASKGAELGQGLLDKYIHAATYRQNVVSSLQYQLGGGEGNKKEAEGIFGWAQRFAQETPASTEENVGTLQELITQRFSVSEAKFLAAFTADMSAIHAADKEERHKLLESFGRIKGRGYASGEDLESLLAAHFNLESVFDQLLQQPGFKELMKKPLTGKETKEERAKSIKETLSTGQVSSTTLINAAVASMNQGKELSESVGSFARKMGLESLEGAISNASNAFNDMLQGIDLVGSEGGKALVSFLNRFTEVTMQSGVLKNALVGLWDSFMSGLNRVKEADIKRMINTVAGLARSVINFFQQSWEWLDKLMHAEPGAFLKNIKDVLIDVGSYIGQGILKGVAVGAAEATGYGRYSSTVQGSSGKAWGNLWEDTGGAAASWVADAVGIKKTGQVLKSESDDTPPPWVNNIQHFAEGGRVTQPTLAILGEAGGETVVPDGMSVRGGGHTFNFPIQVVNASGMDADELAGALQPLIMREFNNIFQRGAMELGAG